MTQVAITPMACDCEREIWNNENKEMKAANLLDSKLKLDEKELKESKGQLHCLMDKSYQYTLVRHYVGYHHDTFSESKTLLFEIQQCFLNPEQSPIMGHGGAGLDAFVIGLLVW